MDVPKCANVLSDLFEVFTRTFILSNLNSSGITFDMTFGWKKKRKIEIIAVVILCGNVRKIPFMS